MFTALENGASTASVARIIVIGTGLRIRWVAQWQEKTFQDDGVIGRYVERWRPVVHAVSR